jgi:hypothetical protein
MDFSELTFVVRGASGGGVWEQGGHGVQERGGCEAPGPSGDDFLSGGCQGRAGCGLRRGLTAAGARDDNTEHGATSGPDDARVSGNRRRSGPASDRDDDAEGGPTRAATLGAETTAAARNEKMNRSRSELCDAWEERSRALVQIF